MPNFGKRSKGRLETCHPDIQKVMNKAIELVDFTILEGRRNKYLQNLYYSQGKSKLKWPDGKHNCSKTVGGILVDDPDGLSRACDIAPWPIDWGDSKRFILLAGVVLGVAHDMGIGMRWGGDWDGNFKFNESFIDMPHFELVGVE